MLIAFPVLPLLASTMVSPGRSSPSRSARSIMYFAMRALIDPEGLRYSSLAHIPSTMTSGVSPIASKIVPPPSRASRAAERVLLVAFMPAPSVAGHWVSWPVPLGPPSPQIDADAAARRLAGVAGACRADPHAAARAGGAFAQVMTMQ